MADRKLAYRHKPGNVVEVRDADTDEWVMTVTLPEGGLRPEDMPAIERQLLRIAEQQKGGPS